MPEKRRFQIYGWRSKGWLYLGASLRIRPWPSLTVYLIFWGFEVGWI